MKLSEHLLLAEVEYSTEAIKRGINNKLPYSKRASWFAIAEKIFEPVRETIGKPIYVLSGYRSSRLNNLLVELCGASENSHHLGCDGKCAALDLWMPLSRDRAMIWFTILEKSKLPFCQLIWEFGTARTPAWVHVSYVDDGKPPRKQLLQSSWGRIDGVKRRIYKNLRPIF